MILTTSNRACYVYAISSPSGKQYIGKTKNSPSSRFRAHIRGNIKSKMAQGIHYAIKKYGAAQMTFRVIAVLNSEQEAYRVETLLIDAYGTLAPRGYNLNSGGRGGFSISDATREKLRWSDDRRKRISIAFSGSGNPQFGKKASDETRRKLSAIKLGKKFSIEHREKLSLALKGKPKTEQAKRRLSEVKRGKPVPEATLRAAIQSNLGRPLSVEHRLKISEAQLGPRNHHFGKRLSEEHKQAFSWLGRKHSPETKEKMSAARSRFWQNKREEIAR